MPAFVPVSGKNLVHNLDMKVRSLFGSGSMMWRISRESVTLVGGRAALLMQIAHPLVAAGVAAHSDYRADPYARLRRTLDTMYTIVYESADDAREAAARVARVHSFVKGAAPDGAPYSAEDPHLKLWVHATLVYTSLKVYERFVTPLTEEERARYYDETRVVASLFGIPEDEQPTTYEELKSWMRAMMDREVVVGEQARELAAPILRPLSIVPRRISRSSVTVWLLPKPIREGYGLKVGARDAALVAVGGRASRMLIPLMPGLVRAHPAARAAERRIA